MSDQECSRPFESSLLVFAGMPRTGSTSLFHLLGDHPQVFRPFRKEMGYFLFNAHRGERWYRRAYARAQQSQICIDVTPEYFVSRGAAAAIHQFGRDVRVAIGVRDPATFARSLYLEYSKRFTVPPFEEFLDRFTYRRGSATIDFSLRSGMIRTMLEVYRQTFRDRLLLYDFDAFCTAPIHVLAAIQRFAAIEPWFGPKTFRNVHMNRGDRRTVRWVSAIASAEPLINLLSALLPDHVLHNLARSFYGGEFYRGRLPAQSALPNWLTEAMRADRDYVDGLFQGRRVVDGVGNSLDDDG